MEEKEMIMFPLKEMPADQAGEYIETVDFWFAKKPEADGAYVVKLKQSAIVIPPKDEFERKARLQENSEQMDKLAEKIKNTLERLEKKGVIKKLP